MTTATHRYCHHNSHKRGMMTGDIFPCSMPFSLKDNIEKRQHAMKAKWEKWEQGDVKVKMAGDFLNIKKRNTERFFFLVGHKES